MILAETLDQRRAALEKILPMQREDFLGIFREMGERPVTDPAARSAAPRVPSRTTKTTIQKTAQDLGVSAEKVRERTHALKEANPMLGHRGCRLGITNPEIYEMQVRAILEAAGAAVQEGIHPNPEIMIPLVGARGEFERLKRARGRGGEEGGGGVGAGGPLQDRDDDRGPAGGAARQPHRLELPTSSRSAPTT